jgi:hypothetical protein
MAFLDGFDASKIEPGSDFAPVPVGEYLATITASERKKAKSGNGEYLELTLKIMDGEAKGRQLFARLNLWNQNQTAARIAAQELSSICRAVNVLQPHSSEALHNLPLSIRVEIETRDGKSYNVIRSYGPRKMPSVEPVSETRPGWMGGDR